MLDKTYATLLPAITPVRRISRHNYWHTKTDSNTTRPNGVLYEEASAAVRSTTNLNRATRYCTAAQGREVRTSELDSVVLVHNIILNPILLF